MPMKKLILGLTMAWMMAALNAAELAWTTDLPAAKQKAAQEKKLVLINFTGSDWCPWCFKLRDEIFKTPEFAEFSAKNLVLVEIDFPRKKQQPDDLKKANRALQQVYAIRGYPTVIVLDSQGKKAGQLGYMRGGPKPFIAELEKLRK